MSGSPAGGVPVSGRAAAGSTAKGGILGRRKRVLPEPSCYVTMWRKTANGRLEQVRCLLSEARKYAAEATLAERGSGAVKSGRHAGVLKAQKSPCCRYCGVASEDVQICPRCEQIRDRHEAAAGGWIGDDQLYLRVQRTLANRERTAAAERLAKHGPGRLEREGPAVKVSDAVAKAKRDARASFHQRSAARATGALSSQRLRHDEKATNPEPPEPSSGPTGEPRAGPRQHERVSASPTDLERTAVPVGARGHGLECADAAGWVSF
jgi:hypothetical protein